MVEKIRVILRSKSAAALRDLLRAQPMDLNCGGPKREADGSFTVEAFVPRDVVPLLQQSAGISVTVDEGLSERTAQRQREVGAGNRFKDRRETPRGPGRKK